MENTSFWDNLDIGNPELDHSEGYFDIKHNSHEKVDLVLREINGSSKEKSKEKSSNIGCLLEVNKENRPNVVSNKSAECLNIGKGPKPKPMEKQNKATSQMRRTTIHQKPKKLIPTVDRLPSIPSKPKDQINPVHQKKIAQVTSRMQNYAKIYAERKELLIKKLSTEESRALKSRANQCQIKEGLVETKKPTERLTLVQRHAHGTIVGTIAKPNKKDCPQQSKSLNVETRGLAPKMPNFQPKRPKSMVPPQVKVMETKNTANERKELYERKKQQQIDKKRLMEQLKKEKLDAETKALRKQTEFKAKPYKNPFKK